MTSHITSHFDREGIVKSSDNQWAVQDAKARFSEFLDDCLTKGPQTVTRRGARAAVLVPIAEYERLTSGARKSLKDLLTSDDERFEMTLPVRGQLSRRSLTQDS